MHAREQESRVATALLGWGDALFKDIPVGGCFRFRTSPDLYRKAKGGWYHAADGSGPRFKTGALTAVFQMNETRTASG